MRRLSMLVLLVTAVVAAMGSVAFAVSGGGYEPSEQGCPENADAHNAGDPGAAQPADPVPGCNTYAFNVEDGNGNRYVHIDLAQVHEGDNTHNGTAGISLSGERGHDTIGTGFDTNWQPLTPDSCGIFDLAFFPIGLVTGDGCSLTPVAPSTPPSITPTSDPSNTPGAGIADLLTSAHIYNGSDDNMDTGEHDGVDEINGTAHSANGPSDGGAIVVNWHPLEIVDWVAAVANIMNNPGAVFSNPIPVADGGFGMCADGICESTQTRQRTVYNGGGGGGNTRDVYNYDGKEWDPEGCSSGSYNDESKCYDGNHAGGMDDWRANEAHNVVAEPGVQVYEDPDPEGSPIADYPLPAAYVGTCGVVLGGGTAAAPASPFTNSAQQIVIGADQTGC